MAAYYGNSYCTLAAVFADDASEGFLKPRLDDLFYSSHSLPAWTADHHPRSEVRIANGLPHWSKDIREASMYTRGWVLQERALSKRTLHWGRRAVL